MDQARPDWRVLQELGLAQAEAGHDAAAIETLEQVIEVLTGRQHYDLPPATATRLAELHEQRGNLERAADLYRALTEGSDGDNLPAYHRKAAGLLERLGMDDEAHRLGQRADALEAKSRPAEDPEEAGSDAEAR
jgi:tetratricopeptide (TPR) repeat protein